MESWNRNAPRGRLPVTLLTGFLGSGKTCVLNHLVRQPMLRRTLVLINEFGAIGIDHDLVTRSREDVIVEMTSGCLCCTIRGDLVTTLREAPGRFTRGGTPLFNRVVIETTGLADPAPILHTLMNEPVIARDYRLEGVITVIDAVNGAATLDRQAEAIKQAAVADRLLLSKTDIADPSAVGALKARLQVLNPAAPIHPVVHGAIAPEALFTAGLYDPKSKAADVAAWLQAEAYADAPFDDPHLGHDHGHNHDHAHHPDINRHDDRIRAFCVTYDAPIAPHALESWFEMLLTLRGADLLRIKGIVNIAGFDGPAVIHGVQHVLHPLAVLERWPGGDRRTRIVFITRDIPRAVIEETLRAFAGAADCLQPAVDDS
jgi:G3E family GTPase